MSCLSEIGKEALALSWKTGCVGLALGTAAAVYNPNLIPGYMHSFSYMFIGHFCGTATGLAIGGMKGLANWKFSKKSRVNQFDLMMGQCNITLVNFSLVSFYLYHWVAKANHEIELLKPVFDQRESEWAKIREEWNEGQIKQAQLMREVEQLKSQIDRLRN